MNNFSKISFKKSSAHENQCPKDGFIEFAFIIETKFMTNVIVSNI